MTHLNINPILLFMVFSPHSSSFSFVSNRHQCIGNTFTAACWCVECCSSDTRRSTPDTASAVIVYSLQPQEITIEFTVSYANVYISLCACRGGSVGVDSDPFEYS